MSPSIKVTSPSIGGDEQEMHGKEMYDEQALDGNGKASSEPTSRRALLNMPLISVIPFNLEKALYLLFALAGIVTRFWHLGERVMSHDESLHSYFSWALSVGRGFQDNPLMHGPFLFHINALIFSISGANDFTARISAATFGVALILLPWALRRWMGRAGALITSFMFLISPMLMFYARYIRDESFDVVWIVLIVWAMFAYLRDRQSKWLYLFLPANVLFISSMEVAFIYAALFEMFLALVVAVHVVGQRGWGWNGLARVIVAAVGVLAMLALGSAIQSAVLTLRGLGPSSAGSTPPVPSTLDIGLTLLILGTVAVIFGLAAFGLLNALLPPTLREVPAFDLAMALAVFYLPPGSPFAIKLAGFHPQDYSTVGLVRSSAMFLMFLGISIALGMWWNRRRLLIGGGIWYGIFITLFTTVFTNPAGLATGMFGSLGYWLAQQGVDRGSQPFYYYAILVPLYEYFPFIISSLAIIVYAVKRFKFPAREPEQGGTPEAVSVERQARLFVLFLVYMIVMTWIAFSVAGEKMPWLTVYFTLPMILLSGHFLGSLVEKLDWAKVARAWGVAILVPVLCIAFFRMTGALGTGAFAGQNVAELTATAQWITALVILVGVLIALWVIVSRAGWGPSVRIVGVEAIVLLAVLTFRTAWLWSFVNYNDPTEFGVYAHGAPGVKIAMQQIDEISRHTASGHALKVAYDSDAAWPFTWYLRDYPNATFFSGTPTPEQLDAPVIILGSADWATVGPALGDKYDSFTYTLIWWPMQDYMGKSGKGLTWNEISYAITNPQMRQAIFDIWLNRDYGLYDQITGETNTLDNWPLVHEFRLYVRKDVAQGSQ
jgi:uncharacterized protein (TIGR03663 family)